MTEFEAELEVFRKEEESAQQFFFSYLPVRTLAASNPDVLRMMNTHPLFWVTTHYSMLVAAFVALGRIFDQDSKHNIDRVIGIAAKDLSIFSLDALRARKEALQITKEEAAEYVPGAYKDAALSRLKQGFDPPGATRSHYGKSIFHNNGSAKRKMGRAKPMSALGGRAEDICSC